MLEQLCLKSTALILTISSIPASWMALQLAAAVRAGTIGRPRRTVVAALTA